MSLFFQLRRFVSDRRGNIAILTAFTLVPLLVLAGGATDIARHEAYRVQLQDGVDRAVLAAASLSQTRAIEATVEDYLKSLPFVDDVDVQYSYSNGLNARQVTVTASYEMETGFLPLIGIPTLMVNAHATAREQRSNIELSLMLDFSGSMAGSKYTSLKTAATQFVDTMLTAQTKSYTSMNVVPYAGQVSVGETIFNALGGARAHSNSSCFELYKPDYAAGLINFAGRKQVPHFTVWNDSVEKPTLPADLNPAWCPSDNTSISFMTNDAASLKTRIAGYKMYDGTGTAIAMNWGMMLLDPALRPLMQQAVAYGLVPAAFSNRPAAFDDNQTVKVLVLMTDGAITEQYMAKNPALDVRAPNNEILFFDPAWNRNQGKNETKQLLTMVCDKARLNRVVVFTIGFQLRDSVASELAMKNELRACASSPSHYYDVQGLNISAAFQSIASTIQQLRLTQ